MPGNEIITHRLIWDFAIAARPYYLYVRPFYLSLLHANFASRKFDYDNAHSRRIAHAANTISNGQLNRLLKVWNWRARLSAAWFVALSQRSSFVEKMATLLLESEFVFAGQGYCVALGLIGGESCQNCLREYLNKYLPFRGRYFDQSWAIGALAHIQGAAPQEFLDPTLWKEAAPEVQPLAAIERFEKLTRYLQQHQMIVPKA